MAGAAEQGVDRIALHALEEVPAQEPIGFHMPDLGFDGGSASELEFEGGAELPGAAHEDPGSFLGHPMALVAPVDERELRDLAREPLHLVDLILQGVPVVGVLRARLDAHAEAFLVGDGEADLDPEFVGTMRLPLGDALHFGRVEAVDLRLALPLLGEDQIREDEGPLVAVVGLVAESVHHMPHQATCADLEALLLAAGPFEMLGLGVAGVLVEGGFHRARVGLMEVHGLGLRDAHHGRVDLAVEAGIRGMRDGLGLHRGIHDHPVHAALGDGLRAQARLDGELEQPLHALLTDPLPPLRHLARVDRELVLEEFLAGEELVVGVLDPTMDDLLVRELEGVLEEVQARHEPDGHARAAVVGAIQAPELGLQRGPIDEPGQAIQLLARIQDHLEAPAEHGLSVGLWAGDRFHKNPPDSEGELLLSGGFYRTKVSRMPDGAGSTGFSGATS